MYLSADLPSQTGNMRRRMCCQPYLLIIKARLGVLHKGPVTFACQRLVLQIKPSQPFPLIKVVHQCKLRSMLVRLARLVRLASRTDEPISWGPSWGSRDLPSPPRLLLASARVQARRIGSPRPRMPHPQWNMPTPHPHSPSVGVAFDINHPYSGKVSDACIISPCFPSLSSWTPQGWMPPASEMELVMASMTPTSVST